MTIDAFVQTLAARGVTLTAGAGRLRYRGPRAALTAEVLAELARRKEELLAHLARASAEHLATPAQASLWFVQAAAPDSAAYNIPFAARVRSRIDVPALRRALEILLERHASLRSTFALGEDGRLRQHHGAPGLAFDAIALPPDTAEDALAREIDAAYRRPFDLAAGPVFRASLFSRADEDHALLLVAHHAVCDARSIQILLDELREIYPALVAGAPVPPPRGGPTFAAVARAQARRLAGPEGERLAAYWERRLAGALPVLALPVDRPRPAVQRYRGEAVRLELPPALTSSLRALASGGGATLYMVLLAAYQALLHRLTGQTDLVVGTPAAGRQRPEVAHVVGHLVNAVPLRASLAGDPTFTALLADVRRTVLDALEHQDHPLPHLLERLAVPRDLGVSPLFQASFGLQPIQRAWALTPALVPGGGRVDWGGLVFEHLWLTQQAGQFDLALELSETSDRLVGELKYAVDLFERPTIERWAKAFARLLDAVVADPATRVSALPLLGDDERDAVLRGWQGETVAHAADASLVARFEAQATRTPDATALIEGDRRMSYATLARRANALAHRLAALGVGPERLVAVIVPRSIEFAVAVLGVLKAGGAYVPLDPGHPAERIGAVLTDAGVTVAVTAAEVVATRAGVVATPPRGVIVVTLDDEETPPAPPVPAVGADHLACVIYTSGSTGRPKGSLNTHGGLANRLAWMGSRYPWAPDDVACLRTSLAFVDGVAELFGPLLAGVPSVVLAAADERDPAALARLVARAGVTRLVVVPSLLQALLAEHEAGTADLAGVRVWCCSGERLMPALARRVAAAFPHARLVNLYGSTEVAADVTAADVSSEHGDVVPIGRPLWNTRAYVLDARMQPVPPGVVGELYVGGAGLARGYLGRPALTAERFVADPHGPPGARLYRMGDLARWRADGALEYVGRADHQVKLRGFRIEPGEIEGVLRERADVAAAVVVAQPGPAGERLVAYVVAAPDATPPDVTVLRDHLARRLPDYMIPAAWVTLDALPLTASGKVDRRALPAPDRGAGPAPASVEPRGPEEEALCAIFAELLDVSHVDVHTGFFDLGGHSLLAAQLVNRLRRTFGVELALRDVFARPTVSGLASAVAAARAERPAMPPLVPRPRPEPLPLSPAQRRLWFLDRLTPGATYHIPLAARLDGPLDVAALAAALDAVVARHESLRTLIDDDGGEPRARIVPADRARLVLAPIDVGESDLAPALAEGARAPFDLGETLPIRARLFRLGPASHVLLVVLHHVAADGWSVRVLAEEIAEGYRARVEGTTPALRDLPMQYADWALWQAQALGAEDDPGSVLARPLAFWRAELAGLPDRIELPADHPRPAVARHRGATVPVRWSATLHRRLAGFARDEGATLFMVLHAALATLLMRHGGGDDIAIGTPVANRGRAEVEGLAGVFVNTLVLRTRLGGDPSFRALLARVRARDLEAYAHADLPFERLVELLRPARSLGHHPLFQVMLALQPALPATLALPRLTVTPLPVDTGTSKFDLTLALAEHTGAGGAPAGLTGTVEFDADLFEAATVAALVARLERLLEGAVVEPDTPIGRLPLLSEAEHAALVADPARRDVPRDATLPALVARQVARAPSAVALMQDDRTLTYAELDARARRLARRLVALGVGPERLVAVALPRTPDLVVALLAVLKAGGAYLPLDPAHPVERLRFMLEDARPVVWLTTSDSAVPAPANTVTIRLDGVDVVETETQATRTPSAPLAATDDDEPSVPLTADHAAYVIYTSGSTGRPKGTTITHGGLANLLLDMQERLAFGPHTVHIAVTTVTFDIAALELFLPLVAGGRVVVARSGELLERGGIAALVRRVRPTSMQATPALWRAMLDTDPEAVRGLDVLVGGEALQADLARELARRARRVTNLYGPTETTIWSTAHEVEPDEATLVPIGRPIANSRVYVLDERLAPVPPGVPGEAYIAGAGLARGYLRRPGLTAERFVADPHASTPGARMYRTGDLACRRADGVLEFLGRMDRQLKVRGFRIEPGEVEAALLEHPSVAEAAVVARGETLVAYVVARGARASEAALRASVAERLPDFMVPSAVVTLDALPLTANGKVDRGALAVQAPDARDGAPYVAPRDPEEGALAAVFAELLPAARVGVHDDFFALGGHSLLATLLVNRVRRLFGVELPLAEVFARPTVAGLRALVRQLAVNGDVAPPPPVTCADRGAPLPLSYAQQRLWFLDRLEGGGPTYNVPLAIRLRGRLDAHALADAFRALEARHESLRTTFALTAGGPVQVIGAPGRLPLVRNDCSALPDGARDKALHAAIVAEAEHRFDLLAGPLVRARLVRLATDDHALLVTFHHAVTDGWALGVFFEELAACYRAALGGTPPPLPAVTVQYADYAAWQRAWVERGLGAQLAYWRERLRGAPDLLPLPADAPRPAVQRHDGDSVPVALDGALTRGLRALARAHGATLFMVLHAGFVALLSRLSGATDVLVGTPVANRRAAEVERTIGLFVNTLVLRTDLGGDPTFGELVGRVKDAALGAYAHQDVPFERLVDELRPTRSLAHAPLVQVMAILQNAPQRPAALDGVEGELIPASRRTAKLDLTLDLAEIDAGIAGVLEYSTSLFARATAERWAGALERLLAAAVAHPETRLSALPLSTERERALLLEGWQGQAVAEAVTGSVAALFAAQVARTPDAVALLEGATALTYRDLDRRAAAVAERLLARGAGPERLVGIALARSIDFVVAALGVLRTGAAYVPLDPAYPPERLAYMIEDAGLDLVVEAATDEAVRETRAPADVHPDALAYVIYTSGSTGRPKGSLNTHRGLVNRLAWMWERYPYAADDVCAFKTSVGFVDAVAELFGPLLRGVPSHVLPGGAERDVTALAGMLVGGGVTRLVVVPSLLQALLGLHEAGAADLSGIRLWFSSGERLAPELAQRFHAALPSARLVNLYGSTEVAADVTDAVIDGTEAAVPIGRPLWNTRAYVLDARMTPAPVGVVGELYVGGAGLARGYLRRPGLTAERFVPDPFGPPGARLYRMGDLARWRADGVLEYLGRADHQVKVRGFRVEPGEVEAALLAHPGVGAAAVTAWRGERGDRLVGYVTGVGGDAAPDAASLRAHLARRVPDAMIPAAWVALDRLPMTASGKIDRRALPSPDTATPGVRPYVAPARPEEAMLCRLVGELLGIDRVGVHDNFFDLGGHSLLLLELQRQLAAHVDRPPSIVELFRHPTIATLAQFLAEGDGERAEPDGARVALRREAAARYRRAAARGRVTP